MNKQSISRRDFLRMSALATVGVTLGACNSETPTPVPPTKAPAATKAPAVASPTSAAAKGRTVKIGYVSPQTGPLAGFGEADNFLLADVRKFLAGGISIAGAKYPVEILVADTQSNAAHAKQVAADLISKQGVDLIVVAGTPDTVNPVSDQCEASSVPCISNNAPWQAWYYRDPNVPASGYKWTYHFFWGLEDFIAVNDSLWQSVETNKTVGALWPNDPDGLAFSDEKTGWPPALKAKGYRVVDAGRYEDGKADFTKEISLFKDQKVEIVTGVMIPPDLATFLTQADKQGFKPKMVSVGKAALFPSAVEALGALGDGLTAEIWWSPNHPFKSSLTGASSKDLAAAYTKSTGKQWTEPVGYNHSLFEVAVDVLTRTKDISDKASIVAAIKATNLTTIVGPVAFTGNPVPNVAKTPLVGGQWGKGKDFPFDLTITTSAYDYIPVAGKTHTYR